MAQKEGLVAKFLSTLRYMPEDKAYNGIKRHGNFKKINGTKISRGHFLHYLVEEPGMLFVKNSTMSIKKGNAGADRNFQQPPYPPP